MDEPGVRKDFHNHSDAARVRRGLQDERPAELDRQCLEEIAEGGRPGGDLPGLGVAKGQEAAVAGPAPREAPVHVGREPGEDHEGDLVLLDPAGQHERLDERGQPALGPEERPGVERLKPVRRGKPGVERQEFVEISRPAPIMAEDEHRPLDLGRRDRRPVPPPDRPCGDRVPQAQGGDPEPARPPPGVDPEPLPAEHPQPVAERDPFEGMDQRPGQQEPQHEKHLQPPIYQTAVSQSILPNLSIFL